MEKLIQNALRSDVQSIENAHYNDQFPQQIQALLEYGMYDYALNRVMQFRQQIENDTNVIIQIARKFNQFKQHKKALEILKLTNIQERQLDISKEEQIIIFKQYYIETLTEVEGVHNALKDTKNIFNDEVRKLIQDELHLMESPQKQDHEEPKLTIQIPPRQKNFWENFRVKLGALVILLLFLSIVSYKQREKIKILLKIILTHLNKILGV